MPHTKSAEKRLRQSDKRRRTNRTWMKGVKKETREVADALATGDAAKIATQFVAATVKLDKAAAKGIIHKNKAARLKSRMAKRINKAKAAPAKTAPTKA